MLHHRVVDVGNDAVAEGGLAVLGFGGLDHLAEDVLVAHQDQESFCPGDGGVEELPVEKERWAADDRHDDHGELTALAFVHRHGIGVGDFVHLVKVVGDPFAVVKENRKGFVAAADLFEDTNIAVVDSFALF